MTLTGLLLCGLPLLQVLGYESSAVTAAAVSLVAPALWWRQPWRGRPHQLWLRLVAWGLALLLPGLLLLLLNALRVPNCDIPAGLAFYGLLAGGAVAVCALWALLVGSLTRRALWRWLLYLGIWLAAALSMGLYLALEPPVVAFQPVIGYFAGSIYDEALSVSPQLVLYRLWNLCFVAAALLALEWAWCRRQGQAAPWALRAGLGVAVALWLGVWCFRAPLGLELDQEDLEAVLVGEHQTEHFVIRYDPAAWHGLHIEAVGRDHELRYEALARTLGPHRGPQKLRSYLYRDREQKGRLLGIRNTLVAKLWLGQMHVLYQGEEDVILTHEMAHLLSAPHGSGPLRLSPGWLGVLPNMGMVEGLAEALTWSKGELTLHAWSAAMRRRQLAPDLRLLLGGGFYQAAGGRAYTVVGSFCRYLLERWGPEKLLLAYGSGDFAQAYGVPLEELVTGWEQFVDALPLSPQEVELAGFYFERGSIFTRRCARSLGALLRQGQLAASQRRFQEALACTQAVYEDAPGEPGYAVTLALAWGRAGQPQEGVQVLEQVLAGQELSRAQRAQVLEALGDLQARLGQLEPARASWAQALDLGPPWAARRSLVVKGRVVGQPQGRRYFFGDEPAPLQLYGLARWAQERPQEPLARYLLGRKLWSLRDHEAALPHLEAAVQAGEGALGGPEVYWEARRLLLSCLVLLGQRPRALELWGLLRAQEVPPGIQAQLEPWGRRLQAEL